jgi:hypothetical protein
LSSRDAAGAAAVAAAKGKNGLDCIDRAAGTADATQHAAAAEDGSRPKEEGALLNAADALTCLKITVLSRIDCLTVIALEKEGGKLQSQQRQQQKTHARRKNSRLKKYMHSNDRYISCKWIPLECLRGQTT